MPKSDFGQILLNKKQELAERRADELEQEERKEQQTQKALQNLSDAVESSEFYRGAPDVSVRVAAGYFKVSVHSRPEDNFRSEIHFLSINWWDQLVTTGMYLKVPATTHGMREYFKRIVWMRH